MTTSRFPEITDELLSAYIDNAVTPNERALVEQAASEDGAVAWRLATLRETVALLRALPVLNAPRAFVLTPEMVGQSRAEPVVAANVVAQNEHSTRHPARQPAPQPGWWARLVAGWRAFWGGGSPVWRNALATSMAALLVLLVLPALLRSNTSTDFAAAPMVSQVSQESAAAPASEGVVAMSADAARVENATSTAGKLAGAATAIAENDNPQNAEAVALAPAASVTESQAPLARSVEGEAVAAPAEVEIVAASAAVTTRTIPGAGATEDALGAVASAEGAPANAAAASAPSAPELAAPVAGSAAPGDAMLAAPLADAAAAAPASPQTLAMPEAPAAAVNPEVAAPTATVMSTATAAPTAVAVAGAEPRARVVATAPVAVTAIQTTPLTSTSALAQLLPWLQLAALSGVVAFGLLWWRSRRA